MWVARKTLIQCTANVEVFFQHLATLHFLWQVIEILSWQHGVLQHFSHRTTLCIHYLGTTVYSCQGNLISLRREWWAYVLEQTLADSSTPNEQSRTPSQNWVRSRHVMAKASQLNATWVFRLQPNTKENINNNCSFDVTHSGHFLYSITVNKCGEMPLG